MTFDAKSLLTAPLPPDFTVDMLVAALAELQAIGMGGANVKLPDGAPVRKINLVAHGEQAAHFVLADGTPGDAERMRLIAAAPMMLKAFRRLADSSDVEMCDGDLARDLAFACILEATGEVGACGPPTPEKN